MQGSRTCRTCHFRTAARVVFCAHFCAHARSSNARPGAYQPIQTAVLHMECTVRSRARQRIAALSRQGRPPAIATSDRILVKKGRFAIFMARLGPQSGKKRHHRYNERSGGALLHPRLWLQGPVGACGQLSLVANAAQRSCHYSGKIAKTCHCKVEAIPIKG